MALFNSLGLDLQGSFHWSILLINTMLLRGTTTVLSFSIAGVSASAEWTGWGGNIYNNRWASEATGISSSSIKTLTAHCSVPYPNGVSATPVLAGNVVYYPSWNGSFTALDYTECKVLWTVNVTALIETFAPTSPFQVPQMLVSRASPQVDGNIVYLPTMAHALVIALSALTGEILDMVQVNQHELAVLTMSPTLFEGTLLVGASSVVETSPMLPNDTFVGNFAALKYNAGKGKFTVLWNLTMIPEHRHGAGWSGAGLWGSQPAVDPASRQLFVATGNVYTIPSAWIQCQIATGKQNYSVLYPGQLYDPCLPGDVWQDSVLAIDLDKGTINWVHQRPGLDPYQSDCGYPGQSQQNTTLCPEVPGGDFDFGMAPTFVPMERPDGDLLVIGRKNGDLYAISAHSGHMVWSTATSPAYVSGGLSWGIAVDDQRIYYTAINGGGLPWQLKSSNRTISGSAYGAVSLANGTILWETEVPSRNTTIGPPSVVGDLVLVARNGRHLNSTGEQDVNTGGLVAMEKSTGRIVMDYGLDANIRGGVAVQSDYILLGTGYPSFPPTALVPGGMHVMKVGGK